MVNDDFGQFAKMVDGICSLISRDKYTPNATSLALFFDALRPYSLEVVQAALKGHRDDPKRGQFPPSPADIIYQIQSNESKFIHISAEEAWAICLPAANEANSVVWTEQMRVAFRASKALLVGDSPDHFFARQAFKSAYEREVRRDKAPPVWVLSAGWDADGRAAAVFRAQECGRLASSTEAGAGKIEDSLEVLKKLGVHVKNSQNL
jgi:hypothetical protein